MFTKADLEQELKREISPEEFTNALNIAIGIVEEYCDIKLTSGEQIEAGAFEVPASLIETKYKPLTGIDIENSLFDGYKLTEIPFKVRLLKYGLIIEPPVLEYVLKYSYGYSTIPAPLERAIFKICVMTLVKLDKPIAAVESYSSGGTTYRFLLADSTKGRPVGDDFVDSILNMYKLRRPLIR